MTSDFIYHRNGTTNNKSKDNNGSNNRTHNSSNHNEILIGWLSQTFVWAPHRGCLYAMLRHVLPGFLVTVHIQQLYIHCLAVKELKLRYTILA